MFLRLPQSSICKFIKHFSTINSTILKPYPNYVERQVDLTVNTTPGDELIEINRETKVQIPKPSTFIRTTANYIDTNPLGDKNQSIVLLVHGYPGTHESTINLIEQFQQRNFRCIAPDMPYCGKTKMPLWASLIWRNSVFLRGRFLGELMKNIMQDKLVPIHTVIGCQENVYALMSMIDQYHYFHCKSLILIDPVPRKLLRFFPLAKLAFDFGRLPLHWPVAKFFLKLLGYQELLKYPQRDIMAALRIWMMEDTHQYDAYIHNLWLSRLRTMIILSDEDKYLEKKLLNALIKDLAVEPFNKSNMAHAVIKKYACDHNELLTDRVSYITDDIEIFLSMLPAATIITQPTTTTTTTTTTISQIKERKKLFQTTTNNEQRKSNIELDENSYQRASTNDFFSNAFGPSESDLKPNQSHSVRSTFEKLAGDFIQRPARGEERETLASVKEEMRKKKIRIDTKM